MKSLKYGLVSLVVFFSQTAQPVGKGHNHIKAKSRICDRALPSRGNHYGRDRFSSGVDYDQDIVAANPIGYWVLSPFGNGLPKQLNHRNDFDDNSPLQGMSTISGDGTVRNGAFELTAEAWVRLNPGGRQRGTVAAIYTCDAFGHCSRAKAVLELMSGGLLRWSLSDKHGKAFRITTFDSVADGHWHHVAAIYDRSRAMLYVDGELVTRSSRVIKMVEQTPEHISAAGNLGFSSSEMALENVNRIAVYARALSRSEIRSHSSHPACRLQPDTDLDDDSIPPAPIPTFAVSVSVSGNGLVNDNSNTINCGAVCDVLFTAGSAVTLTAIPSSDSGFTGWSGGVCTGTGPCQISVDAAINVVATFTLNPPTPTPIMAESPPLQSYSLSIKEIGNGLVVDSSGAINCGSVCSASFESGTVVTLTATPAGGSIFAGWSGGWCSGIETCTVTLSTAKAVTALFLDSEYPLNIANAGGGVVSSSPAGINCGSTCSTIFPVGTFVTLTAVPSASNQFYGWSGGWCSGLGQCMVTINQATTVFAVFQNALTIYNSGGGTVISSPSGIDCGSSCVAKFNAGTTVTLTAIPDSNATFTAWGGGWCGGNETCNITLEVSKMVWAYFRLPSYPLVVSITGNGTISDGAGFSCSTACSQTYATDTVITLSATPAPGGTFLGWGGGWCSGTDLCIIQINQVSHVFPVFSP